MGSPPGEMPCLCPTECPRLQSVWTALSGENYANCTVLPPFAKVLSAGFCAGERESVQAAIRESFVREMLYLNQSVKVSSYSIGKYAHTHHALVPIGLQILAKTFVSHEMGFVTFTTPGAPHVIQLS